MTIPAQFAQINWIFGGTGCPQGAQVTLGVDIQAYAGSPTALATDAVGAWIGSLLVEQSTTVELLRADVKFGPDDVGPTGSFSDPSSGGFAGTCSPPNVSYLIRKNTAAGGRQFRGRMYIPGVAESAVNESGLVLAATVTALQAAVEDLAGVLVGVNAIPVLLHEPPKVGAEPPPTLILDYSAENMVATQRRRLR